MRISGIAWLALIIIIVSARTGIAQESKEKAEILNVQAKKIIKTQSEEAISLWTEAMKLSPDPRYIYNIAVAYEWLKRKDRALEYYQKYLIMAPDAPDKEEVSKIIENLKKAVSQTMCEVSVEASPADVRVSVDGVSRGEAGGKASFWLSSGMHILKFEKEGYVAEEHRIDLKQSESLSMQVTLNPVERFGSADILGNEAGADVSLDNAPAGKTPVSDLKLKEGSYKISISKKGFKPQSHEVQIKADTKIVLNFMLEPVSPAPIVVAAAAKTKRSSLTTWGWVTSVSGIAIIVTGGFLHWKTMKIADEANALPLNSLDEQETYKRKFGDKYNSAQQYSTAAAICYTLGGAALIVGIVMFIADTPEKSPKSRISFVPLDQGGIFAWKGNF
jgi:tetratricopeptide (TPR) repeat protein